MKSIMIIFIMVLGTTVNAQNLKYLTTKGGYHYYEITGEMNLRKTGHSIGFDPIKDNRMYDVDVRFRILWSKLPPNSKIEKVRLYDTYEGGHREFHGGGYRTYVNPSGWQGAKWDVRDEGDHVKFEMVLTNWKDNWNRYTDVTIIYKVPDNGQKWLRAETKIFAPSEPRGDINIDGFFSRPVWRF